MTDDCAEEEEDKDEDETGVRSWLCGERGAEGKGRGEVDAEGREGGVRSHAGRGGRGAEHEEEEAGPRKETEADTGQSDDKALG